MRITRRRIYELLSAAKPGDGTSLVCDQFLIALIALNVVATVLESVPSLGVPFRGFFYAFELFSVAIFSVEYVARLWCAVESPEERFRRPVRGRLRYSVSAIALIDLLAILPFYAAAFFPFDLRFLRVLRILRIFKLSHYFSALDVLLEVVRVERNAFGAAFFLLLVGMLFAASGIYLFEHEVQPVAFGSIPAATWWALVTLTTVGYGDVTPVTVAGKVFGAWITVMGIGMVALPSGILASGFSQEIARRKRVYGGKLHRALEDGVIDDRERAELESLRRSLGLAEEDVAGMTTPRRRRGTDAAPLHKCPHCGESLVPDPVVPPRDRR